MTNSTGTQPLTPKSARETLKKVIDPEIYQNIVDLGLVYDIVVADDNAVDVTMTLTTPHCPMGPQILENVNRVLIEEGATSVHVEIVWEPMWTPYAMTEALQRQLGIIDDEEAGTEEEEPERLELPPPPPQKKGLLGRLFGG
jgi:metal-sulfur cluster biosynthetic enzyme